MSGPFTPSSFKIKGDTKAGYSVQYPHLNKEGEIVLGEDGKPIVHNTIYNANEDEHISWDTESDGSVKEHSTHYTPPESKPTKEFKPEKLNKVTIPFDPDCLWD